MNGLSSPHTLNSKGIYISSHVYHDLQPVSSCPHSLDSIIGLSFLLHHSNGLPIPGEYHELQRCLPCLRTSRITTVSPSFYTLNSSGIPPCICFWTATGSPSSHVFHERQPSLSTPPSRTVNSCGLFFPFNWILSAATVSPAICSHAQRRYLSHLFPCTATVSISFLPHTLNSNDRSFPATPLAAAASPSTL